ncbi:MAG: ABC-three component system protein [Nitrospirota bacterium]
MVDHTEFRTLKPKIPSVNYTSEHIVSGIPIPKTRRIELFSPDDWEEFTEEWATSLVAEYYLIRRFAGSGDKGLDVVGFISDETFQGGWDNYQCKHYGSPLTPSSIWIEIGKIIYYSFSEEYPSPRKYYFICSKGIGTSLSKLLADPTKLKSEAKKNWSSYCENQIVSGTAISLSGELKEHFDNFDFSIFSSKSLVELIDGHAKTTFHSVRFGGGLPPRPASEIPPSEIAPSESRYIQQIFEAYSDNAGEDIASVSSLNSKPDLRHDFLRQRERFYHAESLRNFARDTVPSGTFEELQENIYHGVVDVCESAHGDGLVRMRATIAQSAQIPIVASPLASVVKVQDKQGICHQLANNDRVKWVKK